MIYSQKIFLRLNKVKEITFYNKEPIGKAKTIIDKIENSIKAKFADQNITYITIGSMADGNYIWEWSDYDSLIILNDEKLNENKLKNLQFKILILEQFYIVLILFRIIFCFLVAFIKITTQKALCRYKCYRKEEVYLKINLN